jgi:hypothetical protein
MQLKEWQAILIAYGVLLILAETELGPLASLMAWGVAVTYFVDVNVTQGNLLTGLFAAPTKTTPAPTTPAPTGG